MTAEPVHRFFLTEGNELRFEASREDDVTLELKSGEAEIFGTPLMVDRKYLFPPASRSAVFTWSYANIHLAGKFDSCYVTNQVPMALYVNVHYVLEELRALAEKDASGQTKGPVLMIVGPTDVGKSTLCRILCNYAVVAGRSPMLVDLDVGQGSISLPGTVGALNISRTADIFEGFDRMCSILYHFGRPSSFRNMGLYFFLVNRLAHVIKERRKINRETNCGGVIINTPGWITNDGYSSIIHAAEQFEVDVIVVLEHEQLYNELQRDLPRLAKLLRLPKSEGVRARSRESRAASRNSVINKYFFGTVHNPHTSYTFEVPFDEVVICKIEDENNSDKGEEEDRKPKVVRVEPSEELTNRMVSLSLASNANQSVLTSSLLGFIVITSVNMERRLLKVLSSKPQPLASRVLILSYITFAA